MSTQAMFSRAVARASIVSLLALSACARCTSADTDAAVPSPWADVTLAQSTSTTPVPEGLPTVVVSTKSVRLAGSPVLIALADEHGAAYDGPREAPIATLARALDAALDGGRSREVAFVYDATTAYRIVAETVLAVARSNVGALHFVVAQGSSPRDIRIEPTRADREAIASAAIRREMLRALGDADAPPTEEPLALTVAVTTDGYALRARGANVAPGCNHEGPGRAVPKRGDAYDVAALTACATRLRGAPAQVANPRDVTVTAEPSVPFSAVVAAIDAVRVAPDGSALFPRVTLGAAY